MFLDNWENMPYLTHSIHYIWHASNRCFSYFFVVYQSLARLVCQESKEFMSGRLSFNIEVLSLSYGVWNQSMLGVWKCGVISVTSYWQHDAPVNVTYSLRRVCGGRTATLVPQTVRRPYGFYANRTTTSGIFSTPQGHRKTCIFLTWH